MLLKAFARAIPDRVPAASSGTMNNLTLGGIDPRNGAIFSYYETIAGGMGACSSADGNNGIHTHMTNSLNTPIEALEYAFPLRVAQYRLRSSSGGTGRHRGGDGIIRELELLTQAEATILSDRRRLRPYGIAGGEPGKGGRTTLISGRRRRSIASKQRFRLQPGDRLRIETPGGGGWGTRPQKGKR